MVVATNSTIGAKPKLLCWTFATAQWFADRIHLRLVRHLWRFLEALSTWFWICRLGAKKDPTMSSYSLRRATKFCARRARHNCMITLPACGSMLTLGVFRRGHIFLGFGSLVLSGADIPYACFDPLHRSGGSRTGDSQSNRNAQRDAGRSGARNQRRRGTIPWRRCTARSLIGRNCPALHQCHYSACECHPRPITSSSCLKVRDLLEGERATHLRALWVGIKPVYGEAAAPRQGRKKKHNPKLDPSRLGRHPFPTLVSI